MRDPQAAGKQIDDKTKQSKDDHPSESTPPSTKMQTGGGVTKASAPGQVLSPNSAGGSLPLESQTKSPSVSTVEADGASQTMLGPRMEQANNVESLQPSTKSGSIAFSVADIGTRISFVSSSSASALRDQLSWTKGSMSAGQDKECPADGSESAQPAPCNEAQQAESKEMKENEDPGTDSLLDTSQDKSFSEEPATDSSCSATLPPEQTHSDREKQRPSGKRKKKKRHSKSYSGSLFYK